MAKLQEVSNAPVALMLYWDGFVPDLRYEWEPMSKCLATAGFRVVIAEWHTLSLSNGSAASARCHIRETNGELREDAVDVTFLPAVVLTTWGSDPRYWDLYHALIDRQGCIHSESPLLSSVDDKVQLELCLRAYEARTGLTISRPRTVLPSELESAHFVPGDERVIVKPAQQLQGKGIEILARRELARLRAEFEAGLRQAFVVQDLVRDQFLIDGRKWDLRFCVGATSLDPLRYTFFRQGVAKPAGLRYAEHPDDLGAWLTNTAYRNESGLLATNLVMTEALATLEQAGHPLTGFWDRLETQVQRIFSAIAMWARDRPGSADRAFFFPGFDFIIERLGDQEYQIHLLELNSHPGILGTNPAIVNALQPALIAWFASLRRIII